MDNEPKNEEECVDGELCGGEGFYTIDGCDHEGEHTQTEIRCECNPLPEEFDERI